MRKINKREYISPVVQDQCEACGKMVNADFIYNGVCGICCNDEETLYEYFETLEGDK